LSDFDIASPLDGAVRMARCGHHTRSRHSKACALVDRGDAVPAVAGPIGNSTHPPEEPTMTASTTRRTTAARSRMAAVGAIAVAGALILTGCGDQTDKSSDSGSTDSSSAPLADKLPDDIRKAGVIKVGSDIAYPPVEFMQDGKPVGIDPDMAEALSKQ